MRSLDDRLDNFAEAWKPEPGDKLIGTVVDLDERDSAYGDEPYPIVTVQNDDGNELAFHASTPSPATSWRSSGPRSATGSGSLTTARRTARTTRATG